MKGAHAQQSKFLLPSWKDVLKAKAARARVAQANACQPNAHDPTAADVDEKADRGLGDMIDHHPPQIALHAVVEEMKNPDVKIKEELLLSDEFLLNPLTWDGINYHHPIPLPKHIAEFGFTRAYISHLYGGNTQDVFPPVSKDKVEWHGLADWAFLSLAWNPHAPTRPGYSGLYFTMDNAALSDERETLRRVKRTFVRLDPNRWVYVGQYRFTPGPSLTADLWKEQSIQVRRAWARGIFLKDWGVRILLRIWFRRERGTDFKPEGQDIDDAKKNIERIRKTMTEEDMMGAYDRGEEEIGTFRMTCTGYDAEFQRVLQRNAHSFVPKPRAPRGTKRGRRHNVEVKPESDEDDVHVPERAQKPKRSAATGEQQVTAKQAEKALRRQGLKRKPSEVDFDLKEEDDGDELGRVQPVAGSSSIATSRPKRAAAMVKRQRTS